MSTNLMLIASGSGTDANAIMRAHAAGQIPEVGNIVLVSTKSGAGCLEKATVLNYPNVVVEPQTNPLQSLSDKRVFLDALSQVAKAHDCGLVFLVGCNVIIPYDPVAFPIWSLPIYNIHPADTEAHGGNGMHGPRVHEHVLMEILDLIRRGKRVVQQRFFTYPTVHEVTEEADAGTPLLRGTVEIPPYILQSLLDDAISVSEAAQFLQKVVLPYEWLMLPAAVRMAATRILGYNN